MQKFAAGEVSGQEIVTQFSIDRRKLTNGSTMFLLFILLSVLECQNFDLLLPHDLKYIHFRSVV